MVEDNAGIQTLTPLRVEMASPSIQWDQVWSMARQKMMGPDLASFMFKLLHQILPTAERVSRILPNKSPSCTRCTDPATDTLLHSFFDCQASHAAGEVLLNKLSSIIPNLTPTKLLTLDVVPSEEQSFPITWNIANFLSSSWQLRSANKPIELYTIRSEMEAACRLLREERLASTSDMLKHIFS